MNQASSRSHCVFTIDIEARSAAPAPGPQPNPSAGAAEDQAAGGVGGGAESAGGGGWRGATLRRSRLNFVDLAGSERVGKTGSEGTIQREAR